MILEYHRPGTLDEALLLLARSSPKTIPLGGGTDMPRMLPGHNVAVVDLQNLSLGGIDVQKDAIIIGATQNLQSLADNNNIPETIRKAVKHDINLNQRQLATIAGTLIACDGRSSLVTTLLAMDARLKWLPGNEIVTIGDYLPLRRGWNRGVLMASVQIPRDAEVRLMVTSRTPADLPIVCASVCQWPSGRTRVALGGFGSAPILVMDGPEPIGADLAARDAYKHAEDDWASADYRSDVAARLTLRMIKELGRGR